MDPKTDGTLEAEIALHDRFWANVPTAQLTEEEEAAAAEVAAGQYQPDCTDEEEDCI